MTALADHLARHIIDEPSFACSCGWVAGPDDTWPDHVAAAWAEHRTVLTIEELDALPECVLVRDKFGEFFERGYTAWWSTADETGYGPEHITLPATILHNPEEDQ